MATIGYAMCSSQEQADSGLGLEAQEAAIRAHCPGCGTIFRDEGLSGTRIDRPGLIAAIDALDKGDVLVVAKRDRLARDLYLMLTIEQQISKAGATLEAADGQGNGDDPTEKLLRQILAVIAEYEGAMIRARTKLALKAKRERGEKCGGKVPFGYRISGFRTEVRKDREVAIPLLEEDPEQQKLIKQALEMRFRSTGRPATYRMIAHCLGLKHPEVAKRIVMREARKNGMMAG